MKAITIIRTIAGFLIAPLVIPAVMVVDFFTFRHLGVTEIIPAYTFRESVHWGVFGHVLRVPPDSHHTGSRTYLAPASRVA